MFMPASKDRLFSPRFFLMCGFSFTVFLSAFLLFPTAPFHVRDLGGSTFAAGLFLACLTYASACSAPVTGAIADRVGLRRTLVTSSLAITLFSVSYAVVPDHRMLLALAVLHGLVWSGLLTGSGAYMSSMLPVTRRAEGISYWGLSSVLATAIAPTLGFWIYSRGWLTLCACSATLNLAMAAIAWRLPEAHAPDAPLQAGAPPGPILEWRVLVVSFSLFMYSFGYGAVTSFAALYADSCGVTPTPIFLTTLAVSILVTRPFAGPLADRIGYRRVLLPCLGLIAVGLGLLAASSTRAAIVAAAAVFGTGYGTAYPVFAAWVLGRVDAARRGAAFGAIIAAFDTGIGTGSLLSGLIIQQFGYRAAFGAAAGLAALSIPYYLATAHVLPPPVRRSDGVAIAAQGTSTAGA
jgi:MFS family permease